MPNPTSPEAAQAEEEDEFGIDQKRMSFLEHLLELRWRLLICIATIVVATLVFLFAMRMRLFAWLCYPIKSAWVTAGNKPEEFDKLMFVRTPGSLFMASIYYCLFAAIGVTIPVTVWQLWGFVAPGLKRKERRVIGPAILVTFFLFAAGAAFGYFVLVPIMYAFFIQDSVMMGVRPQWDVAEAVKLEAFMMLVLGITFETPLVIVALSKLGILSPKTLAKHRRYAILLIFVAAALITPTGDPLTMSLMAGPLIVLYEVGILAARFFRPKYGWPDDEAPTTSPQAPPEPYPPGPAPASVTVPVEPSAAPDYYPGAEPQLEGPPYTPPVEVQEELAPPETAEAASSPEPEAPREPEPKPESEPEPEAPPTPPDADVPPDALMH